MNLNETVVCLQHNANFDCTIVQQNLDENPPMIIWPCGQLTIDPNPFFENRGSMKRPASSAFLGVTFLLFFICRPADAIPSMDMKQTLDYAVENAPTLKIFKNRLEVARIDQRNAFWQMFPSVDLNSEQGWRDSRPNTSGLKPWTSTASLGVTANIYNNTRDYNNYQIAKLTATNQQVEFVKSRNQIVLEIIQSYYRLSRLQFSRKIQRQRFDILKQQFKTIEQSYRSGTRSRRDYLRFKAQVRRAEVSLIALNSQVGQTEQTLKRLIGMPQTEQSRFQEQDIKYDTVDPRQIPAVDIRLHYDYLIASNQINIEVYNRKLSKRLYYPEVFLDSNYNFGYTNYLASEGTAQDNQNWSLLLGIRYNLFDGGRRRRNIEAANLNVTTGKLTLQDTALRTREIVRSLDIQARNLLADLKLNKELLDIETRSYANIEREYRNGQASYLDFINGLNDLLDTKTNFQTSYFNYLDVIASLRYHKGTIYEDYVTTP